MAAYFLGVNRVNSGDWINDCTRVINKAEGYIKLTAIVAEYGQDGVTEEKLEEHPFWVRIMAGEHFIGSVASKTGKVRIPELPIDVVFAEDIHEMVKEGEVEIYLVGRIFLDDRGYQALILSDEKHEEWLELDASKFMDTNTKKEVKTMNPRNITGNTKDTLDHTGKAIAASLRTSRDIARLSVPVLRTTSTGLGKLLKGTAEGLNWFGKKLDRTKNKS